MSKQREDEIDWPEMDEWNTPAEKMPNCPRYGEDELGVIHRGRILCYACGWEQTQ